LTLPVGRNHARQGVVSLAAILANIPNVQTVSPVFPGWRKPSPSFLTAVNRS
jgi:hypothetical protein